MCDSDGLRTLSLTLPRFLSFIKQVDSLQNFTWQQQLRYYWDMDLDDCLIRHSDAKVRYGYEYMGATRWVVCLLWLQYSPRQNKCPL